MLCDIMAEIRASGAIAIIRGIKKEHLRDTVRALIDGGISCVEITLNTPAALGMIAEAKEQFGGEITAGAGTVLEEISAREAILAGADFVLAPTLDLRVIALCNTYAKLAVPGCFTPTEALTAAQAGAQLIKIFPVGSVGPTYIKDLLAPLPQLNLLPVGGVGLENAAAFMQAGAYALGVGSCLVNPRVTAEGRFAEITATALELRRRIGLAPRR